MRYSCHERSLLSRLSDECVIRIYIIHLFGKRCKYLMQIHSELCSLSITSGVMGIYTLGAMVSVSGLYPDGSGFESQSVYMGLWLKGNTASLKAVIPGSSPGSSMFFLKRRCGGMADATDSKPVGSDAVRVRLPSSS